MGCVSRIFDTVISQSSANKKKDRSKSKKIKTIGKCGLDYNKIIKIINKDT